MENNHEYPNLLYLGIESCGICKELLNGILGCKYENLIELELWLGCIERGYDIELSDLNNLFKENQTYFPELKYISIIFIYIYSFFIYLFIKQNLKNSKYGKDRRNFGRIIKE